MIIAIHQPQYLPWLGYFDKMDRADIFVFLDSVQFKKNEWQNRNRIKTAQGWQWLTVPVKYKYPQLVNEVEINNTAKWQRKQWQAILSNYSKAPHYRLLREELRDVFSMSWDMISDLNIVTTMMLARVLGIETSLSVASAEGVFSQHPDERLIVLAKHFGADTYLAGSGGSQYMDLSKYAEAGIKVVFQDYKHPVYGQLFGEFISNMSVIDLIFNCGKDSLNILRGGNK